MECSVIGIHGGNGPKYTIITVSRSCPEDLGTTRACRPAGSLARILSAIRSATRSSCSSVRASWAGGFSFRAAFCARTSIVARPSCCHCCIEERTIVKLSRRIHTFHTQQAIFHRPCEEKTENRGTALRRQRILDRAPAPKVNQHLTIKGGDRRHPSSFIQGTKQSQLWSFPRLTHAGGGSIRYLPFRARGAESVRWVRQNTRSFGRVDPLAPRAAGPMRARFPPKRQGNWRCRIGSGSS